MTLHTPIDALKDVLIASIQADAGSPMDDADTLTRIAQAAIAGGARGIRANGPGHIAAMTAAGVDVPIIGLHKRQIADVRWITPFFEDIEALVEAGADIIAVDATIRRRPDRNTPAEFIRKIIDVFAVPVLADVDSLEAGIAADEAGATAVATTLSGYTPESAGSGSHPDLHLIESLTTRVSCPIVAEGRFETHSQVSAAFEAGAHAVVAGKVISDPTAIAQRLIGSRSLASDSVLALPNSRTHAPRNPQ